jgi:hypothetical protein
MNLLFNKQIINIPKLDVEIRVITAKYQYLTQKGDQLNLMFSSLLTQDEINSISYLINNFVETSLVDTLAVYMDTKVACFIRSMMYKIQAENIAMGITQYNKTYDVLATLCEPIQLPNKTRKVSIKQTLDTGSLTVTLQLIDYLISTPELYEDLNPFITVERLTDWKTLITTFLAQPI